MKLKSLVIGGLMLLCAGLAVFGLIKLHASGKVALVSPIPLYRTRLTWSIVSHSLQTADWSLQAQMIELHTSGKVTLVSSTPPYRSTQAG